jgi:(aminoalkyl)phosphonate N-acetyltransferase
MSEAGGAQEAPPRAVPESATRPRVRAASLDDVVPVAAAIEQLLVELGGERPARPELEAATRELIENSEVGALFVADAEGEIVGVLAASWQHALHVPGRYGTVQDLWVDSAWRSRAIGRDLLEALFALAREQGIPRIEVGLPQDSFAAIEATRSFYVANGFAPLGPRMRWLLR